MPTLQHTPSPWTANGSHIYAPDGAIIAVVSNPGARESDYPLIANRDLMAAAPDLLAVAEDAPILSKYHGMHCFEVERFIDDYGAWMARRRAAIALATTRPAEQGAA